MVKSGPDQLLFPNKMSPSASKGIRHEEYEQRKDILRLTFEPLARERLKPLPAGTVNPLILTVVHSLAAATSSSEFTVAVQFEAAFVREAARIKKAVVARCSIL